MPGLLRGGVDQVRIAVSDRHAADSDLAALGLGPGKPAMAVVSPGVVIICQSEWVEVFEEMLRDFPSAFICEAEAAPQKVSGPGGARSENGVQER